MLTPIRVSKLSNKLESTVVGDIWTSNEAFKNLTILCDDFGSRFAGTEGEKRAVDFISSKFEEYGLDNVKKDEFTYHGWKRGKASLEMLTPYQRKLDAISLALSPSTPNEGIEEEIIHIGTGSPEEFKAVDPSDVKNKIVMCSSATSPSGERIHRRTKYGFAVDYGAKGFIFMNHNAGQLMPTGSLRPAYRMSGEIPGIGVSMETGRFIIRQIEKGPVKVRMRTTDQLNPNEKSWNVVAEIPGGELRSKIIVVGAHFDGHDIAQGALDDGAGAVTIMEAARALAKYKGKLMRTIRFICFAAEELGVTGSTCYVEKHQDDLDRIDLMINCDGAGRGLKHGFRVSGPKEIEKYIMKLADKIEYPMDVNRSVSAASDHWPFYMQGIPATTFHATRDPAEVARVGRGWGHTSADTLDKVDPRGLTEGAATLARCLIHFANEPNSIAHRTSKKEIIDYLEKKNMVEKLKIQKKWHPDSIR